MLKTILIAASALALAGAAQAATFTGTFTDEIVTFGGTTGGIGSAAEMVVTASDGALPGTVSIDFSFIGGNIDHGFSVEASTAPLGGSVFTSTSVARWGTPAPGFALPGADSQTLFATYGLLFSPDLGAVPTTTADWIAAIEDPNTVMEFNFSGSATWPTQPPGTPDPTTSPSFSLTLSSTNSAVVPVPAPAVLLLSAVAGLALRRRLG